MAKLTVELVTAERSVLAETDVDMVVAPATEGDVGILPRHAALLTTLRPGSLRIKKDGAEQELVVSGGFMQVNQDRVMILADTAERADEIDSERAEAARQRAANALAEAQQTHTPAQVAAARAALRRSMARLDVVRKRRRRSL